MVIYVLDSNFRKISIIKGCTFLQYYDRIRETGTFTMTLPMKEEFLFLFSRIEQYYFLFDDNVLAKILTVSKEGEDEISPESQTINISGKLANFILEDRIVYRTNKVKNIKTHQFVKQCLERDLTKAQGNRKINAEVVFDDEIKLNSICSNVTKQITGDSLYEEIVDFLYQDDLGIVITPNVVEGENVSNIPSFAFNIIGGTDRTKENNVGNVPVVFSTSISNVKRTTYSVDKEPYKNVLYIAGQGEGDERIWTEYDREESPSGWNRQEHYVDARDMERGEISESQYVELLVERGKSISDIDKIEEYNCTVVDGKQYKYGVDFFLGDWVTVVDNELNVEVDVQIVTVIHTYDEVLGDIIDFEFSYGRKRTLTALSLSRAYKSLNKIVKNGLIYMEQKIKELGG